MLSCTDALLLALLMVPILATLLPLVRHDHWLFRIGDFPRVQIAVLGVLFVVLNWVLRETEIFWFRLFEGLSLLCCAYQLREISAYTRLRRPEVVQYVGEDNGNTLSLISCNVLTANRRSDLLLAQVKKWQPDVVLTLESDKRWEAELAVMECEWGYAHTVKVPLDNLYGMHLYSRLPLRNMEVRHWVSEDIPSLAGELQLRSGAWIRIFCLHPMPPSPTEADTSTTRDAELLLVAREIARGNDSVLVFGDLNDVAWSRTTRLFQKISGLLDPRKGRGLYSTFHAGYWFLRWPLDHIFHSCDFLMSAMRILPSVGSDHFPVYGKFQYAPVARHIQEETVADAGEMHEAKEKIAAAEPLREVVAEKYVNDGAREDG